MNYVLNITNGGASNLETTLEPFDFIQNYIFSQIVPHLIIKFPEQQTSRTTKEYIKFEVSVIMELYVRPEKVFKKTFKLQ